MKVAVTGSTSLLGRHVVDRLVARGDAVTTFQRSADVRTTTPDVREILGDISDRPSVAAALADQDAVIHLAAKVGVTGRWEAFERTNVGGSRTVLECARKAGVHRFVHVSSPSVAHPGKPLVGADAEPADPNATRGHYATSKALAELYALSQSTSSFPVCAIRPHLVWGPGDTQLVGRIVSRAEQGRLAIVGSGSALIDTTYVDNAADALVAALDATPHCAGEPLVVTNGEPRTLRELVERIVDSAGMAPPRLRIPKRTAFWGGLAIERVWERRDRTDDPPMTSFVAEQLSTAHWFDQRRTREMLGWKPAITLDEGFDRLRESFV